MFLGIRKTPSVPEADKLGDAKRMAELEQQLAMTQAMLQKSKQETAAALQEVETQKEEVLQLRQMLQAAGQEAWGLRKTHSGSVAVPQKALPGIDPNDRDKKVLLEHLQSLSYVRLGSSSIAGVGVFAMRMIPAGVDPFPICNEQFAITEKFSIFSAAELKDIPAAVFDQVKSFFAPLTLDDAWTAQRDNNGEVLYGVNITGLNTLNTTWYLNHSDKPNIAFKDADEDGEYNSYVTRRDIKEGEELVVNYRELGEEYFGLVRGEDKGKDQPLLCNMVSNWAV